MSSGRIVMPGFIDTHHHQFETALRSFLADGVLINDGSGSPSGSTTYFEFILLKFAPVYRPQDVYINELFGGLSQLDDGVTTVHDVSQIHHSPAALGRCHPGAERYGAPMRVRLFRERGPIFSAPTSGQHISDGRDSHHSNSGSPRSNLQNGLVHMIMGGEVYLGDATTDTSWTIGRQLGLQIAAHILSPFGITPTLDKLAQRHRRPRQQSGSGPTTCSSI